MPKKVAKKPARAKKIKFDDGVKLSAYILLDRSGSMSQRMTEAVGSINAYVKELAGNGSNAEVTLASFDGNYQGVQFDVVRSRCLASEWEKVSTAEVMPRGGTPLYDAIDRIVMAAEIEGSERSVIAVLTDGQENESKRINRTEAKRLLDKCRAKGWQVIFMGADFDTFEQAGWVGNQYGQTIVLSGVQNYAPAMRGFATATSNYGATGQAINFTASDRATASGKTPHVNINVGVK